MSITLPSARDQAIVEEAIQQAGEADGTPYEARLGFYVDGEDYTSYFDAAEWGQQETPITLDCEIHGFMPINHQTAKTQLYAEIEGVLIPQLYGEKTAARPAETAYRTNLISSSAGALLNADDAIKMGAYTEYVYRRPDHVVFDVARRLPYDPSQIDVAPIPGVYVDFSARGIQPGFLSEDKTGDVLSKLSQYDGVGYDYADTAYKGFRAFLPEALDNSRQNERSYTATTLPDWISARPSTPEVIYSHVRVFSTTRDGILAWEVIEEVPWDEQTMTKPHANRTLDIPFNDATETGYLNGRRHCVRTAIELARTAAVGEMLLPTYDPLYERGDRFRVHEEIRFQRHATRGHTEILWGMTTDAYKHGYGADLGANSAGTGSGLLATMVAYRAAILAHDDINPPAMIVPNRSLNVVPFRLPTWRLQGDELVFEQEIDWVALDAAEPDAIVFYDEGAVSIDPAAPDEFIIDAPEDPAP